MFMENKKNQIESKVNYSFSSLLMDFVLTVTVKFDGETNKSRSERKEEKESDEKFSTGRIVKDCIISQCRLPSSAHSLSLFSLEFLFLLSLFFH